MLLIYRRVVASHGVSALPGSLTVILAVGYLSAWALFSITATLAHWALHTAALISPTMVVSCFDVVLLLGAPSLLVWSVIGATAGIRPEVRERKLSPRAWGFAALGMGVRILARAAVDAAGRGRF